MKHSILLGFIASSLFLCLACAEDRISDQIGPFGVPPPHASGITITNEIGDSRGVIGTPNGSLSPYPNPFSYSCVIRFVAETRSTVEIEVVRAFGPGDERNDSTPSYLGGTGLPEELKVVAFYTSLAETGLHLISIQPYDGNGKLWAEGYYRIFVRVESQPLVWGDVLLIRDPCHSKYRSVAWPSMPGC